MLGATPGFDAEAYADRAAITEELTYARQIFTRHGWPMIDVSRRSIEETAAAIVALRGKVKWSGRCYSDRQWPAGRIRWPKE